MRRLYSNKKQDGFTLIEVMLVIALMAIVASLIVMNLQGVEQRKVMQAKELLILDLQKIRLEALDQGRILGLVALPATDIHPAGYQVVEYVEKKQRTVNSYKIVDEPKIYQWQVAQDFTIKTLPEQTTLTIEMLDTPVNLDRLKQNQQQLPQLVWLGNGEVMPARLQLFLQQQPIGDAVEINTLGLPVDNA